MVTRTSETWTNAAGLRVALTIHTEDDHMLNSHQCESQYTLTITQPDGTSTGNQTYSVIDNWDRPIQFGIDGFASNGHKLIATTIDGGNPQILVLVYDLNETSHAPEVYNLPNEFLDALSPACRVSVRVVGITREGEPVMRGSDPACVEGHRLWMVRQGRRAPAGKSRAYGTTHAQAIPLRDHAVFEILEPRRPPSM
jgi:hypothetical protein